jgi:hypothetical protein
MARTFSFREMLILADENSATLRSDRRHNRTVAAFGAAEPADSNRYLLIDIVAMKMRDQLTDYGLKRRLAANIVRGWFDQWAECVSRAEHSQESMLFVVADTGSDKWFTCFGPAAQLPHFVATIPEQQLPRRLFVVNVAQLMLDIQVRAQKAGIELGSFFLPLEHPLFVEWVGEFKRAREKALADPFSKPIRGPTQRERQAIEKQLCN